MNGGYTVLKPMKGEYKPVPSGSLFDSFSFNHPCDKCTCVGGVPVCYIHLAREYYKLKSW